MTALAKTAHGSGDRPTHTELRVSTHDAPLGAMPQTSPFLFSDLEHTHTHTHTLLVRYVTNAV